MGAWKSYAALYYPFATFGDEGWLRRALLFWDSVSIIRPAGVEAAVSAAGPVEQLIAQEEPHFLHALTPVDEDLEPVSEGVLEAECGAFDELVRRYGPDARQAIGVPARTTAQAAPANADPRLLWIYAADRDSKMSWILADQLLSHDLAEESWDDYGERWLGLHPRFAAVYLTALAGQMAGRRALVALTDDLAVHRAAGAVDLDSIDNALTGRTKQSSPDLRQVQVQYVHLALTVLPEVVDIDRIPPERLLEFRRDHFDQIRLFREHLATFDDKLISLTKLTDQEAIESRLLELYRTDTEPLLMDLRREMNGFGWRTARGTLGLKVDAAAAGLTIAGLGATAAAASFGASAALATGPIALGLAVLPYLAQRRAAHRALVEASPVSFLLVAGRELRPAKLLAAMAG